LTAPYSAAFCTPITIREGRLPRSSLEGNGAYGGQRKNGNALTVVTKRKKKCEIVLRIEYGETTTINNNDS